MASAAAPASLRPRRAAALPPEERRAAIVAAALPLLAAQGTNVTTRAIAEAAGVAEGTIFRVFPDKDALIQAVLDSALDPAPVSAQKWIYPKGKKCAAPTVLAVFPDAVRTTRVPCRTIRKLFNSRANRGRVFNRRAYSMRPGPYRCVAVAVRASFSVTGIGLWKCSRGRRHFYYTHEAFGSWAYKPFGPLFDPRLESKP